jgi:hypothetical protein
LFFVWVMVTLGDCLGACSGFGWSGGPMESDSVWTEGDIQSVWKLREGGQLDERWVRAGRR